MSDPRLTVLYRAAVQAVVDDVGRGIMPAVVLARGVERLLKIAENDERPAARIKRENAFAMREMEKRGGNGPGSAWTVAGLISKDPHTRGMLAQRFRRHRRRQRLLSKKNEQCSE
jgi:hypothetical protein